MFNLIHTYVSAFVARYIKSERGASAVEYGLLVGGIAVAIIVVVFTLGDKIAALFTSVEGQLP